MNGVEGSKSSTLLVRWARAVARHPRIVVAWAIFSCIAGLLYTAKNISVNTDRNAMISGDLEFKRNHERLEKEFPQLADNLVIVVDAISPEAARRAARALAERLRAQPELFGDVYVPRSSDFLERHALLYLGVDALSELSGRLAQVQPFLGRLTTDQSLRGLFGMLGQALEARTAGRDVDLGPILVRVDDTTRAALEGRPHELSWQELMGGDDAPDERRRQFVLVEPDLDYGRLFPAGSAIDAVREAADGLEARVRITGGLALSHEELSSVMVGANVIGLLVFVMVGTVLLVGLRSVRLVAATLVTLVIGLSWTAAFATAAVGHLNMISIAFGILYVGLGVDYAIHLCLRYREWVERGSENVDAIALAVGDVGGSLVICSLTTALGFFAFIPTSFRGVSELGLISGTGMFISLFASVTMLPALLALRSLAYRRTSKITPPSRTLGVLSKWTGTRPDMICAAAVVIAVGSLALVPDVEFDSNPLNLRDPSAESVQTFEDLLASSDTPPWSLSVLADAERAPAVRQKLAALDGVARAISVTSFVPADQDTKLQIVDDTAIIVGFDLLGEPGELPTLAEERRALSGFESVLERYLETDVGKDDEAARALAISLASFEASLEGADEARVLMSVRELEQRLVRTLPENLKQLSRALDTTGFALDELPPEIADRWVSALGTHLVEVFPTEDLNDFAAMRRFVADVRTVAPDATGSPVMILESGDAVVRAFQFALLVAIFATATMLLILSRSFLDTLLVLVPLLLAGAVTAATMVIVGQPFNFANVIGLPLLLGIGVDSGIHMVHRARAGHARSVLESSTARGVVLSSLTTFCSFVNLSLSPHRGMASMGTVLTIGVVATLVCMLVVLPAMLVMTFGKSAGER